MFKALLNLLSLLSGVEDEEVKNDDFFFSTRGEDGNMFSKGNFKL